MKKLKDIKVIVWDIDGTLYPELPELKLMIKDHLLKMITVKLKVDRGEAEKILKENYLQLASTTRVLLKLGFRWQEIEKRGEKNLEFRRQLLKKDPQLAKVFSQLKNYRHLIATNNLAPHAKKLIKHLGLEPKIFEKFFGITSSAIKPELKFFKRILDYTDLPADQHLFVGDREETEIKPAKELGMKTAKAWAIESAAADICLPEIYAIVNILK